MKQLKVSEILEDLDNGLTRFEKDNEGSGSIQKKYNLSFNEVRELFRHPKLINRKTRKVGLGLSFNLVDDTSEIDLPSEEDTTAVTDSTEELIEGFSENPF